MPQYTTGEIAKLCDVSVRAVQFYDTKGLLKPAGFSEGGRRLYSEDGVKQLRLICMLKSLGLPLDSIKGILLSKEPAKVLLLLLDEQLRLIDGEIIVRQKQKETIEFIKENIRSTQTVSAESISGMEKIMNGKRKLRKVHGLMLAIGIIMDIIQAGAIILWIITGIWWPFAVGFPIVIVLGVLMTRMYYRNTAYICPECSAKFKPALKDFLFSKHTPKTRKLVCAECGSEGWCVETAADD